MKSFKRINYPCWSSIYVQNTKESKTSFSNDYINVYIYVRFFTNLKITVKTTIINHFSEIHTILIYFH